MKRLLLIMGVCVLGLSSCDRISKMLKGDDSNENEVATPAAETSTGVVGEGLNEEEAAALLREEQVQAGNQIGKDDVETELLRMEEEINADVEGREPDFENAGVKKELKPLVAKETFTSEKASSTLEYERDMKVMKMLREYIKQQKAEEEKLKGAEKSTDPQ